MHSRIMKKYIKLNRKIIVLSGKMQKFYMKKYKLTPDQACEFIAECLDNIFWN